MLRFAFGALTLLFVALPAHAQFVSDDPLTLTVSPQNPRPYETVTVTPASNLVDLTSAIITVSVDGKVVEQGGVQSVPITVAGPGGATHVMVSAKVAGTTYTQEVTLHPADVALVVEPITTTHPWYAGGALVAPRGRVRVVAIPDLRSSPATRLPASSLVYSWKIGDQSLADQSGIGRSILLADAPVRYRDTQVTVDVASPDGTLVAEASTVITPQDPIMRIYPTDPLMGPDFAHAISDVFTMTGTEQAFRSIAYFFAQPPSFSWSVNGDSVSTDQDVTVRATGGGEGTALLSVSADTATPLQSGTAGIEVHFGSGKQANIFGF